MAASPRCLRTARRRDHAMGDLRTLLPVDLLGRALRGASQHEPRLSSALRGVTAAVVGVILNLSLWFALHVFFAKVEPVWHGPLRLWLPDVSTLDVEAMLLACLAALLLLRLKFGIAATLAICTSTALAWFMLSGVA